MAYIDNIHLTPEELNQAQGYLRARAYNRAFLAKMAEFGFPADNEEEAMTLLELDAARQQREAAARPRNRYKLAADSVPALRQARASQADEQWALKVAEQMAIEDPDLYAAALGCRIDFERKNGMI